MKLEIVLALMQRDNQQGVLERGKMLWLSTIYLKKRNSCILKKVRHFIFYKTLYIFYTFLYSEFRPAFDLDIR